MNLIDVIIVAYLFLAFFIGMRAFASKKVTKEGLIKMADRYRYHFFLLILVFIIKTIVFYLEGPVEEMLSIDFTPMIYELEGHRVYFIQKALYNDGMTLAMVLVYIGSLFFIITFSFSMFAYLNRYKTASDLALLNLVLLILTIPFYLLVVVYVPSYPKMFYPGAESVVTGMRPLMYNYGPRVNEFFLGYETFNNCFPSLHIAYPAAILIMLLKNVKGFVRYKVFLFIMLILVGIAIIYLGIHWLLDIFGGVCLAILAVMITNKVSHPFWKMVDKFDKARKEAKMNEGSQS